MTDETPDIATRLLDAAEARARVVGYHGFSFRDLAADVGIKNPSVHYHFSTKEVLVARLAERYTDRFLSRVGSATEPSLLLARYRDAFRAAMQTEGQMCLCGMLAAEVEGLPDAVQQATARFFTRTRTHLTEGLAASSRVADPEGVALAALSLLEGAMLLARGLRDPGLFDAATGGLARLLGEASPG